MQSKNSVEVSDSFWCPSLTTLRQKSSTFLIISKRRSNLSNFKTKKEPSLPENYCWPSLLEPGITIPSLLNIAPKPVELDNRTSLINMEQAFRRETCEWVIEGISGKKIFDISKIDKKGVLWVRFTGLDVCTKLLKNSQYHILVPTPEGGEAYQKPSLEYCNHNIKHFKPSAYLKSKGLSKNSINSILKNHMLGAWVGFLIHLDLVGVGYRVLMRRKTLSNSQIRGHVPLPKWGRFVHERKTSEELLAIDKGKNIAESQLIFDYCIRYTELTLKIGYSHDIHYRLASDIGAFSKKPAHICLYGSNLLRLAQIVAEIRTFKKPDPYKGKGFRYRGESIRLKVGKKK